MGVDENVANFSTLIEKRCFARREFRKEANKYWGSVVSFCES
jgi:hypothetical protein